MKRAMTQEIAGRPAPSTGAELQTQVALRPALGLGLASVLLAGALYAALGTGVAAWVFPTQAQGSLIRDAEGQVRGSRLLAQPFQGEGWFQPRPSAANYDPMAAAGSNQARSNPALAQRVAEATAQVAVREGVPAAAVPADLVTQSGSGLDPGISPAAAALQVPRVARATGLPEARVRALVAAHVRGPDAGVFGAPRVNVMELNHALQAITTMPDAAGPRAGAQSSP